MNFFFSMKSVFFYPYEHFLYQARLTLHLCCCKNKTFFLVFGLFSQKIKASSYSCDETKKTVVIVDGCPNSAEKWREAAAKKNCSANANQCTEPGKFVYHCVINAFVNQTLELCAYVQNIVSGMYSRDIKLNLLIKPSMEGFD